MGFPGCNILENGPIPIGLIVHRSTVEFAAPKVKPESGHVRTSQMHHFRGKYLWNTLNKLWLEAKQNAWAHNASLQASDLVNTLCRRVKEVQEALDVYV